jgi:uncharacterized protein YneF (UPF0154 family)
VSYQRKPRIGKHEVNIMQMEFGKNPKLTVEMILQFAKDMGVAPGTINVSSN